MKGKNLPQFLPPEEVRIVENFFQNWRLEGFVVAGMPNKKADWTDTEKGLEKFINDARDNPIQLYAVYEKRDKPSKASLNKGRRGFILKDEAHTVKLQEVKTIDGTAFDYWGVSCLTEVKARKILIPGFLPPDLDENGEEMAEDEI